MKFTQCGTWMSDDFKFQKEIRRQFARDLSKKHCVKNAFLFLNDCESIINFWLSIQEPKTPNSDYKTRLLKITEMAKDLHKELVIMPVDCADSMNAESMMLDRELQNITDGLEDNLMLLRALSTRCLGKLQCKPGQDRSHIKHLMRMIIEAYERRFKQLPKTTKDEKNPFIRLLQDGIVGAIGEPIGLDLYIEVLKSSTLTQKI